MGPLSVPYSSAREGAAATFFLPSVISRLWFCFVRPGVRGWWQPVHIAQAGQRAAASFYAPRTPRLEYAVYRHPYAYTYSVYALGISNVPCSVAFGIFMDDTSTARRRLSTSSWSTPLHHHSTVCTSSHLTEAIPCVPSRGCTHCRDTGLHVPSLSLLTLLPVGQLPGRQANRAVNFSLPRTVVVGFSSPPSIETPYFFKKNEYSIIYIFK
jgi:hypothetical protein